MRKSSEKVWLVGQRGLLVFVLCLFVFLTCATINFHEGQK